MIQQTWWDVAFKIRFTKRLWLPSCSPSCSTILMEARCHAVSYSRRRPTNQGTPSSNPWGTKASIPTACEELSPAHNHLSELRSRSSVHQVFEWSGSPAWRWETLRQRHSTKLKPDSLLTETKMINVCCFKLLSLAVICYAATGNKQSCSKI